MNDVTRSVSEGDRSAEVTNQNVLEPPLSLTLRVTSGPIKRWFAERLPITGMQLAELTNEPVPAHLRRWWFCLGGTPAYLFVVQIVTGILLALYYQPSPQTA